MVTTLKEFNPEFGLKKKHTHAYTFQQRFALFKTKFDAINLYGSFIADRIALI